MFDPIMAFDEKKENVSSFDMNNCFRNCLRQLKDSIVDREKNSMEIEKMSSRKKEIEDLLRDVETTTEIAQSMIDEKAFLFGPLDSIKSHTHFLNSSVSFNNKAIGDSSLPIEKNSDDDDLEILDVIPVSVKKTLPHFGPLKRKKLEIGSKVWIMGRNITSPFVEGMVISSVCYAERGTIYKVKFENEGSVKSVKICTAKELAYKENCDVIVPVGTRIVALYEKMMFAGVVAEHPTHTNRNRYLIFFDDNHAEYTEHKNIHVICGQSDDVADDVYEYFSDFIRTYLNNYPEHALVKFQKNQRTRTEYNGKWERTIVLDIDGRLVKMYFIDKDMIQWIYRGCERFE